MEKALYIIDNMIIVQKLKYQEYKDGRPTRMKNADIKNWGMSDAEERIKHYREVKKKLKQVAKRSLGEVKE